MDYLVIIVQGKSENLIQHALTNIWNSCQKEGLSVNPGTTTVMSFNNRWKLTLRDLKLSTGMRGS